MKFRVFDLKGYNTYVSPYQMKDGEMIHSLNVDGFPVGAKTKRQGVSTLLGTADGSAVTTLFDWHLDDGTTFYLYRYSGSTLYYSAQGTGAWTACGNGTFTSGGTLGHAIMNSTMIVGDGAGSTRHSTDGTSFTNTSLAPISRYFESYQNRIYAGGTATTLFWSTLGDATNWSSAGTADSSSIDLPDSGIMNMVTKVADRIIASKTNGALYRWDGYNLTDMATHLGPRSSTSLGMVEEFKFWLNNLGIFGFGGDKPQLVSNAIQRLIYNDDSTGIAGTAFDSAAGVVFNYDYLCSVGTASDDLSGRTIADAVLKYNFQDNELGVYSFANKPLSFHTFKDANKNTQLIYGSSNGQVYQYGNGVYADAGAPISSAMEFVLHANAPESEKEWTALELVFSPSSRAHVQVAYADTMTSTSKRYEELGDVEDGAAYFRLNGRSRLLFLRIYESSSTKGYTFYGFSYDANILTK